MYIIIPEDYENAWLHKHDFAHKNVFIHSFDWKHSIAMNAILVNANLLK